VFLGIGLAVRLAAQTPSVLNSGTWFKFSVTSEGVYKIDYNTLKKAGFNPDQLDPRQLKLFASQNGMLPQANNAPRIGGLTELDIVVQGESDGKFDPSDAILFYGQGPDAYSYDVSKNQFAYQKNIYSDKNFYFLTVGPGSGKRMVSSQDLGNSFPSINIFDDFGYYEKDLYNILTSGREWFGEQFDASNEITVQFNLPGIVNNSPMTLVSAVMAQSYSSVASFNVSINNVVVAQQVLDSISSAQYAIKGTENYDTINLNSTSVSASAQSLVNVKYHYNKGTSGISIGYLNYFIFSMKRSLALYGNQTIFTSASSILNPASSFVVSSMTSTALIWEITNPFHAKVQNFALNQGSATFGIKTDSLRKFIAFAPEKITLATSESAVPNQNLASMQIPDMLIVTHPDFESQAIRLASYRMTHSQINVAVVDVQDIYNEYSGGKQDVSSIRDFVKDLYTRSGGKLSNLLLFGRCSYDYKSRVLNNTNFVPTYESRNSLSPLDTYSSDDYFGFLEPNEGDWPESPAVDYSMDIGVGRISVVTATDATTVVDKIIDYETNPDGFGPWRQDIVFVADDGDYNIHQSQADQLATMIDQAHPDFITTKIYLDAYKQIMKPTGQFSPDAKDALDRAVEKGAMIVNYTGHGSEQVWTQEQILDLNLVRSFKNAPRYPLFVTATCEFGRHDDPFQISSGEYLLLQKGGGGIGLVTTARPVNSSTNFNLNQAFYNAFFTQSGGKFRNLGAIFKDTKNNSLSGTANRNFSLLGDPSMVLALPRDQMVFTSIKTAMGSDTLKALSTVTTSGEVRLSGTRNPSFSGTTDVTVFDRRSSFVTLGDENPPFTYSAWSNALFRGQASVVQGGFQFQFIIPADIETDIGTGKTVGYANNKTDNASGSDSVRIGGKETSFPVDNIPPDITLFIGDTTFVNGGVASPNTNLIVELQDLHGIAISGADPSNDLIAILDDSLSFTLNDYYTARKNDFTHGVATFPMNALPDGKHHIVVKASDTYLNRSTASIDFIVHDGGLFISEFYNYPNPFSSNTESTIFAFTHNRPGEDLEADLYIYTLSGQLLDSRQYSVTESSSHVTLTDWSGSGYDGNKLVNGIYLGKLSVRSLQDGSKNEQITKLIIVN
jgi:Peptidase family C25